MEQEDDGDAFTALRALPEADKRALFAACVARTLKGQLAFEHDARPEFEATVARLGIVFAVKVRPTAELFWVAHHQGAHARGCPRHPGRSMGAGSCQAQEDGTGHGDGRSLRRRRCRGGRRPGRSAPSPRGSGSCPDSRPTIIADSMTVTMTVTRKAAWSAMAGRTETLKMRLRPQRRRRDGGIDEDDDNRVDVQPGTGDANLPADVADGAGTAGAVPDTGDDTDPQTPPVSVVESIDSPAVAERLSASRADALGALNAVPTADGGPRVIVNTSGFGDDASVDDGSGDAPASADTASGEPAGGNGHDRGAAGLLEIPAFLRRS